MGERKIKLPFVYCPRCGATHPPGEHLAKPRTHFPRKPVPVQTKAALAEQRVNEAVTQAVAAEVAKIMDGTSTIFPVAKGGIDLTQAKVVTVTNNLPVPATVSSVGGHGLVIQPGMSVTVDDGVALKSVAHPKGPGIGRGHGRIKKASTETVEIEIKRSKPVASKKKVSKASKRPKAKAKAKTAPKKAARAKPSKPKTKAAAKVLVEAEEARKRDLKTGRQQRWRAKQAALKAGTAERAAVDEAKPVSENA